MRPTILFLSLLLLAPAGLRAQSGILDGYVQHALGHNPDFERAEIAVRQQQARLDQAKGLFLPTVAFRATYTLAAGGRTIQFPIGDLLNPVYNTLNQLTESNAFPQVENENIQFLPHNFQETHFRVIQPVFNPDIIANKRAQESLLDASKTSLSVAEADLVRDVKQAYFTWLQAAEQVRIYEETRELLEEQLRVNRRLAEASKVTPDAVSQAQVALSQWAGDLARARQQQASARAYFNLLLGRDLGMEVEKDPDLQPGAWQPDLDTLLFSVASQRQELTWLSQQRDAQQWDVQRQRGQWLPSMTVVSDVGFQGFGYNFADDQGFALAQASLNWNLFQGGQRSAAIQEAKLQAQSLQLQSVQLDRQLALQVEQAWYGWQAAAEAHAAAVEGEQHAARLFRQTQQRFLEGQVNALLLEQARTGWTQARLGLNAATFSWLQAENALRYAAGIMSSE